MQLVTTDDLLSARLFVTRGTGTYCRYWVPYRRTGLGPQGRSVSTIAPKLTWRYLAALTGVSPMSVQSEPYAPLRPLPLLATPVFSRNSPLLVAGVPCCHRLTSKPVESPLEPSATTCNSHLHLLFCPHVAWTARLSPSLDHGWRTLLYPQGPALQKTVQKNFFEAQEPPPMAEKPESSLLQSIPW